MELYDSLNAYASTPKDEEGIYTGLVFISDCDPISDALEKLELSLKPLDIDISCIQEDKKVFSKCSGGFRLSSLYRDYVTNLFAKTQSLTLSEDVIVAQFAIIEFGIFLRTFEYQSLSRRKQVLGEVLSD